MWPDFSPRITAIFGPSRLATFLISAYSRPTLLDRTMREALVRHLRLSSVGSLGKANTLTSENPPPHCGCVAWTPPAKPPLTPHSPCLSQSMVPGLTGSTNYLDTKYLMCTASVLREESGRDHPLSGTKGTWVALSPPRSAMAFPA